MADASPPAATPRQTIYLGDHRAVTQSKYGIALYFDTRDSVVGVPVAVQGDWEPWMSKILLAMVRPGDIVVDVGANIGFYSLHFAGRTGDAGHVHSFEANPTLLEKLGGSVTLNGFDDRVTVYGSALGNTVGEIAFFHHEVSSGSGNVRGGGGSLPEGLNEIRVPSTTLDTVFAAYERPVRLLHMDVETAEPLVIEGGHAFIERNPEMLIVLEVIGRWFRHYHDDSMKRALAYLESTGRKLFVIVDNTLREATAELILAQNFINIAAVPSSLISVVSA